jgi:hypothetical protein
MTPEEIEAARLEAERLERENQSQNSNTNDEVINLLRQTVQETNARARSEEARRIQLENELSQIRESRNAPREITSEEYFQDPVKILRDEIAAQLAPLTAFVGETKKNSAYQNIKAQFLADAKYGPLVTKLGAQLDNLMSNIEPTVPNMLNAVHALVGQLAVSDPNFFAPSTPTPKPKEEETIPAHLRPSPSPRPSSERTPTKKNYTENERRLMREAGMTEEQWENYMNAPATLTGLRKK